MKRTLSILLLAWSLTGCFRPAIPLTATPNYPVEVFYENGPPPRPYVALKPLFYAEEVPLAPAQKARDGRMIGRGNDNQQKEVLLARLTLEAKKLGADALVNVRYRYYTTATMNGYSMEGVAVKYRTEYPMSDR